LVGAGFCRGRVRTTLAAGLARLADRGRLRIFTLAAVAFILGRLAERRADVGFRLFRRVAADFALFRLAITPSFRTLTVCR
jgi:hypothetical protein